MFLIHNLRLLWLLVCLTSAAACAKEFIEPEVYLIPEGFTGEFYIVHGVKMGVEPEYEGDARLFRVTDAGVLHTSLPLNHGWATKDMIRFYFESEDGSRTEITDTHVGRIDDSLEVRSDKKTYIFPGSNGGEYGFNLDTSASGCKYRYTSFYVGTFTDVLENRSLVKLGDYYSENGFPCNGELVRN